MADEKILKINGKDEQAFLATYLYDLKSVEEVGLNWAALVDLHDFYCNNTMGTLDLIAQQVSQKLKAIKGAYIVRYRVKDPEHVIDKIIRKAKDGRVITKDNFLDEIDDFVGLRVLHLFKNNWEEIFAAVSKEYSAKEQPVAYHRKGDDPVFLKRCEELGLQPKERAAGYRSIHYVAIVPVLSTTFKCEIQIRTVFEDAWSEIDHLVRYPNNTGNELLNSYLMMFNRLAGCADEMGTFLMAMKSNMAQMQEERAVLLNEIESLRGKNAKQNKKIDELKTKLDKSIMIGWPYTVDNPMQSTLDYIESIQNPSGSMLHFENPYASMQESLEELLKATDVVGHLQKPLYSKFKMPKAGEWPLTMKEFPWGTTPKDKKK
mgnify:CR=1 FL=1